jgi:hypothetical protein
MPSCQSCSADILEATYRRHLGFCKPCWRRKLNREIGETEYGRLYDQVFVKPTLRSGRYLDCWLWVELYFASTLSQTRYQGTAEYLFLPSPRIVGVENPRQYRARMAERIVDLETCVRRLGAETPDDAEDTTDMLVKASELRRLADAWLEFYLQRHPHWSAV